MIKEVKQIKPGLQYRLLEIIPGTLTWATLIGAPLLSYYHPVWISLYIIVFDLYWFLKGGNVAFHLLHSHGVLKVHKLVNWQELLVKLYNPAEAINYLQTKAAETNHKKLSQLYREQAVIIEQLPTDRDLDWTKIYHVMILAAVDEPLEVLENSIASYATADYDTSKIFFILALEERGGAEALSRGEALKVRFEKLFGLFLITRHPDDLPGEIKGKAGNMNWAMEAAKVELNQRQIPYENVIASAFDSDTIVEPNYFSHLTYDFLTAAKPHQTSYQPMPVYHNNIWDTPAPARVIAVTSSFWQLIEASRPDRLITFASHAMSFKTLVDVGGFVKDSTNEDSFIFWQCFAYFNGDYRNKPMYTTASMDAVMGESLMDTMKAQYKQKRRWAYGVAQINFVLHDVVRNKQIPLWKRFIYAERFVEGHYFWATASIMLAILGWLPLILGGDRFGTTVLAQNLPMMTRAIMSVATFFLIFSIYVSLVMLPPRPAGYSRWKSFSMIYQWIFSPIVASVFGSAPAIDAQTRLLLGKYMGSFWVTPKVRKKSN